MSILLYNGQEISQRPDGYVNATQMAKPFGKLTADFMRLGQTRLYMQELAADTGIPISKLVTVIKGGETSKQGSWYHPLLAIELGRWLSPAFGVWCNKNIKVLIEEGQVNLNQEQFKIPTTFAEALRLAADLQEELEITKPKAELMDKITASDKLYTIGQVAKQLTEHGLGQNKLFHFLRWRKILDCFNTPMQSYVSEGYFKVVTSTFPDGRGYYPTVTMATVEGIKFIDKQLSKYKEQWAPVWALEKGLHTSV